MTPFLYIIVLVSYTILQYTDISPVDEHNRVGILVEIWLAVTYGARTHKFSLKELVKHFHVLPLMEGPPSRGGGDIGKIGVCGSSIPGFLAVVLTTLAGAASHTPSRYATNMMPGI